MTHPIIELFDKEAKTAVRAETLAAIVKARIAYAESVAIMPYVTVNEVRAAYGFGPVDGGDDITLNAPVEAAA